MKKVTLALFFGSLLASLPSPHALHADDALDVQVVEKSMHEFMEYVYQPTYKRLKASMSQAPADRAGWKAIKADSLTLAECANLLLLRAPEKNTDVWKKAAVETRKQGAELYHAAGKKDFESASRAYRAMLNHCNACHKTFADGKHQLKP